MKKKMGCNARAAGKTLLQMCVPVCYAKIFFPPSFAIYARVSDNWLLRPHIFLLSFTCVLCVCLTCLSFRFVSVRTRFHFCRPAKGRLFCPHLRALFVIIISAGCACRVYLSPSEACNFLHTPPARQAGAGPLKKARGTMKACLAYIGLPLM